MQYKYFHAQAMKTEANFEHTEHCTSHNLSFLPFLKYWTVTAYFSVETFINCMQYIFFFCFLFCFALKTGFLCAVMIFLEYSL